MRTIVIAIMLLSCFARAQSEPSSPGVPLVAAERPAPGRFWANQAEELKLRALALLGTKYSFGGNSPETGFDCSGFVRHLFADSLGIVLPRDTFAQSRSGAPIASRQLRPGDLVFFNTLSRAFSHVGLYIGDNRFIHAPRRGDEIRIASLSNPYWARRYDGARRVIPNS